jgi:DNA-directed RNA polymerase specialized sigma24 family protein
LEAELGQIEKLRRQVKLALDSALSAAPRYNALENRLPPVPGRNEGEYGVVEKLVDLQRLYNEKWDALLSLRLRIETAIDALDDSTERRLIRLRYIEGLDWVNVCVRMSYSWNGTHKIHRRALRKLSRPL